jgi:hypothetical protein
MGMTQNQLNNLCYHFKIDPRKLTYYQGVQMEYVYRYLLAHGITIKDMPVELIKIQKELKIRGRTRSLYHIFFKYKVDNLVESGRYDTQTWALPITNMMYRDDY